MRKTLVAAIIVVAIAAAAGAALYATTSQAPPAPANDFSAVEQQLNNLHDLTNVENLDSDFGIGDVAGNW